MIVAFPICMNYEVFSCYTTITLTAVSHVTHEAHEHLLHVYHPEYFLQGYGRSKLFHWKVWFYFLYKDSWMAVYFMKKCFKKNPTKHKQKTPAK